MGAGIANTTQLLSLYLPSVINLLHPGYRGFPSGEHARLQVAGSRSAEALPAVAGSKLPARRTLRVHTRWGTDSAMLKMGHPAQDLGPAAARGEGAAAGLGGRSAEVPGVPRGAAPVGWCCGGNTTSAARASGAPGTARVLPRGQEGRDGGGTEAGTKTRPWVQGWVQGRT